MNFSPSLGRNRRRVKRVKKREPIRFTRENSLCHRRTHELRLWRSRLPARIYDASYPIWFLSEATFRKAFAQRCQLVCEYKADDEPNSPQNVIFKGFQFEARVGESSENGGG